MVQELSSAIAASCPIGVVSAKERVMLKMSSELNNELNQLVSLLEAQLPANPDAPANRKLERQFANSLALYFQGLADAFPFHKLPEIYYNRMKEAVAVNLPPGGDDWIDALIRAFRADLTYRLNSHMAAIFIAGSVQLTSWGRTKQLGLPIYYEGPPMRQAIEWADKYCARLVTKADEETKTRLAQVISDGIENKRGVEGITRDIRREFADMSKARAELISQTETSNALGQSFLERGRAMDIEAKQWYVTAGNICEDCLANEAAGVIPFEQPFPSGVMTVPAHPRCACACAPARFGRED
jgi:hypothetical protein